MAFKKFTKLTSGTLLLSATSALTLQAQVGLGANNSSLNDTASKVFLESSANSSKIVPVLKVLGIFVGVGVVVLGVVVCVLVNRGMKRRQLPEKNESAGVSTPEAKKEQLFGMNPDNNGIDQLIEELVGLKVEDFLKGKLFVDDAKKRNKNKIEDLKKKIKPFGIKGIDNVVESLGIAVNEAFSANLNVLAYKDDLEKNDKFLEKARPALERLRKVDAIVYVEGKDRVEFGEEEAKLIEENLSEYKNSADWSFIKGRDMWRNENTYTCMDDYAAEQVKKIIDEVKRNRVGYLRKSFVKYFHLIVERLQKDIDRVTQFNKDYRGKFENAVKKFNESKEKIIKSLKEIKSKNALSKQRLKVNDIDNLGGEVNCNT